MRETEAARALGMTVQVNWVRDGADFEGAFQSIGRERAEALVFLHPDQVVFVIHPDPAQISPRALEAFVVRLNSRMAAATLTSDLQAFEAHPDSEFCVIDRRQPRRVSGKVASVTNRVPASQAQESYA